MKKSLLLKSVGAVAVLLFSATSTLGAAAYEGDLYEALSTKQQEQRGAGAMGPIRSYEAVGTETSVRYEGDMYDKFREPSQALRGAQGPIRSDEAGQEDRFWKDLYQRSPVLGGGNG